MNQALWIAKTGLDAQQTKMSNIANNLANAGTAGFKSSRAIFADLLYQNVRQVGAQSSQDTQLPSGLMVGTGVRCFSGDIIGAPCIGCTNSLWIGSIPFSMDRS